MGHKAHRCRRDGAHLRRQYGCRARPISQRTRPYVLYQTHRHWVTEHNAALQTKPQTLKLNGCVEVSDECIQLLSRERGGIQNLSLAHLRMLTDAGLKACADNLWLEELDVSHCQGVTDKGLLHTIKESPGLTKINISWCRKITDVCIEAMLKLSLLRHADVSCCDALSPEVLDKL